MFQASSATLKWRNTEVFDAPCLKFWVSCWTFKNSQNQVSEIHVSCSAFTERPHQRFRTSGHMIYCQIRTWKKSSSFQSALSSSPVNSGHNQICEIWLCDLILEQLHSKVLQFQASNLCFKRGQIQNEGDHVHVEGAWSFEINFQTEQPSSLHASGYRFVLETEANSTFIISSLKSHIYFQMRPSFIFDFFFWMEQR